MSRSITAADITVLAPDFYTSTFNTRYLRLSAARYNIPIRWYGTGEPYRGWLYTQITRLREELLQVNTEYMLYTDSSDAIFLSSLDEIARLLSEDYKLPDLLMSVEGDGQLCAGGWLGRKRDAIDALTWLRSSTFDGDDENPQTRWREAVADGEIDAQMDYHRGIFITDNDGGAAFRDGRVIYDPPSGHEGWPPCLLHFAGGYTDPQVGKAALIEPVWRQLGYEATV